MKTNLTRTLVVFALLACQHAWADDFIRASGWYVDYANSGYSSKTGAGIAGGASFGSDNSHEVGIDVGRVAWAMSKPWSLSPSSTLGLSGSGHLTPVLGSYRYYIGGPAARTRIYIGGLLGATKYTGDTWLNGSGVQWGAHASKWLSTFGGALGAVVPLTAHISADVGYRYIQTTSTDVDAVLFPSGSGSGLSNRYHIDALKANMATVSLTFVF